MCICACMQQLVELRKGHWMSGTGLTSCCDSPCGCWELKPGSLQELPVLLATESFSIPSTVLQYLWEKEIWDLSLGAKAWDGVEGDESGSLVTLLDWTQHPMTQGAELSSSCLVLTRSFWTFSTSLFPILFWYFVAIAIRGEIRSFRATSWTVHADVLSLHWLMGGC